MDHLDELTRRHTVQRVERSVGVAAFVDLQAPRQRRRPSVQFLIEVVTQPADGLRENDSRCDRIAEGRQWYALVTATNPCSDAAERDGAPDAQAAVPNLQRADQSRSVIAEVGPPVRHDVIKPPTDQTERHCPQSDVVDDPRLPAAGHPTPIAEDQSHHDAHDDEQRIRPNRYHAEMPDPLRRTGDVGQNSRRHAVILCRTPSASSAVSDRTAGIPSFSADTNADPTMTPSA